MLFTQSAIANDLLNVQAASDIGATVETGKMDDGRKLEIVRDLTGAKYRIDGKHAYSTDAGTLITGILVWGKDAIDVVLPLGGRRRERGMIKAPRWLKKDLASGEPVRVFYQRVGELWAVERPGKSLLVRTTMGQAVEFARINKGLVGEIECERPWSTLSDELHVGRIALWSQIDALLAPTAEEQALAEDVRVAAFAAADVPGCTIMQVRNHVALRGQNIGRWSKRMARRERAMSRAA